MKKILFIFIFLISINVYAKEKVTLSKCIDGDTASFIINDEIIKVRFLAVDAPELEDSDYNYGISASNYTCNYLTNAKIIELEYDSNSTNTDKYDRVLAWIWIDNKLLQEELIKEGLAKVRYLYGEYKYTNNLLKLQKIASDNQINIWSNKELETYTVKFIDGDNVETITVKENDLIDKIVPNRFGYKFIGWFNNNKEFDFNTPITHNLELTSKYEDYSYIELILLLFILLLVYMISFKSYNIKRKKRA